MNDKHRLLLSILKLLDVLLVVVAFAVSTVSLVHHEHLLSVEQFLAMRTKLSNFVIFAFILLTCHLIFRICGLYRSMRLSNGMAEMLAVARATTCCAVCFSTLRLIFSIKMMSLRFIIFFWVFSTVIHCVSRLILRLIASYLRIHGRNLRYQLIIGTNPRAVQFARRILASRDRGYRLVGFVDEDWSGIPKFLESGFPLVSSFAGLAEFLKHTVVDEVTIFLPFGAFFRDFSEVANLCEQHGILMRFSADIIKLKTVHWRTEVYDGNHFIATYTGSGDGWPMEVKRLLDILISGILILFLLPVLAAVAVGIKLTSPGPVIFSQERLGLNKRRFNIYKFRTMVPNAEKLIAALEHRNEMAGPAFKMKNDPRITPIGHFLRRSSLDELPQLFNVLQGDMSLVGPRPLPLRDYDGFNEDWQRRRFSVKPGITCLWQVNGRSGVTFEQWMRLDLQYMDEWSLWLDIKILAKTLPAVLKGAGAV